MYNNRKSYLSIVLYVTQLLATPEPDDELTMQDGLNTIHVFVDSDGDIQVSIFDENEEQCNEGGLCVMESEEEENDNINKILTTGTPEEINELITDKALFIWELIHTS